MLSHEVFFLATIRVFVDAVGKRPNVYVHCI